MKITKSYLREIIKEALYSMEEYNNKQQETINAANDLNKIIQEKYTKYFDLLNRIEIYKKEIPRSQEDKEQTLKWTQETKAEALGIKTELEGKPPTVLAGVQDALTILTRNIKSTNQDLRFIKGALSEPFSLDSARLIEDKRNIKNITEKLSNIAKNIDMYVRV